MCLANVKLTITFSYEGANPLILQLVIKILFVNIYKFEIGFLIDKMF